MKKYNNDEEYMSIINSIMTNNHFKQMNNIKHHNTTRMNHLLKVSYYSYVIAKSLKLNYKDVARGGLLHDFYDEEINDCNGIKNKIIMFSTGHPKEAYINSINNFDLTEKEINIIKAHMFPIDYNVPKYMESWIVNFVDKFLSIKEFYFKFYYKLAYIFNLYIILLINKIL